MNKIVSAILVSILAFLLVFSFSGAAVADDLILPSSLTTIETEAFMGDTSLDNVIIPQGVTEIKARTFADSSLHSIHIPASVRSIAADAFAGTDPDIYVEDITSLSGNLTGRIHLTRDTTFSSSISYSDATLIVDQGVTLTVTGSLEGSSLDICGTVINNGAIHITDKISTYGSGLLSIQNVNTNTELPADSFYGGLHFALGIGVQVNVISKNNTQTVTAIGIGSNSAEITASGEVVRLCFIPPAAGSYTLMSVSPNDTQCSLYGPDGRFISFHDDIDIDAGNYNFMITEVLTAGTPYFYDVNFYLQATGAISLILSSTEITSHPTTVYAQNNQTASFHVSASGTGLTYQWEQKLPGENTWEKTTLDGNTTDTLCFAAQNSYDGWKFRCLVMGSDGIPFYSDPASLYVDRTIQAVNIGANAVTISTGGESVRLSFIPGVLGTFTLSSTGYDDTWVKLYDADGRKLAEDNNSGVKNNFLLSYDFTADHVYYFDTGFSDNSQTGNIPLRLTGTSINIIRQPANAVAAAGSTVSFSVTADGTDTLTYRWQEKADESSAWQDSGRDGFAADTLSFTAQSSDNNKKFRCIITDGNGSGSISNEVTLYIRSSSDPVYRALFIPEVNYENDDALPGNLYEINTLNDLLQTVTGPTGGHYTIYGGNDEYLDSSPTEILSAISSVFGSAANNDVSLIYITGHGNTTYEDEKAGLISTVRSDPDHSYCVSGGCYNDIPNALFMGELAEALNNINGKIIIWIDTCGSGAGVYESSMSSNDDQEDFDADWFNQNVIQTFANADEEMWEVTDETGELRVENKFYVLTAAAYKQNSRSRSGLGGYFAEAVFDSIGPSGDMPADRDPADRILTLKELYASVYSMLSSIQDAQVYPLNSSYQLFTR